MSRKVDLQKQLKMAQAQIQRLSEQLIAERETVQSIQSQLQKQLDHQQQQLADLEAREITYRQQFDCNPQPMWIFDLETLQFLKVNDAAIARYGYSRDEFLSMTIADIRPPEDVPRLLANVAQVDSGLDQAGIWRHCLRDGRLIYVEINSYAIEFEGRRAELVMAQDVTERRQAQIDLAVLNQELEKQVIDRTAALAASEARLNLLLNANPAILYSCEPHGDYTCTFFSKNVETLLGYTPEEIYAISDFWLQRLHPDEAARVLAEIPDLFEYGILKLEYRLRHRDDHYVWVYDELTLLHDNVGQPLKIFGFVTDVSDRKKAESQIKQLLTTIENAIDGIGITQNNIFIYANRAQLDMFGYSADELIGQPWIILYSAEEVARLEREAVPVFIRDGYWLGETIATRKDGTTFNQELSLTLSDDGVTIGVSKNISDRKQVEIALRDSEMRYITLAKTAPVGIFRFDLEGNCIYVNEDWCKMTGKPASFALNNQWLETLHPDDVTYTQMQVQQWLLANDGSLFQNEARILRDDGSIVWFYCQMRTEMNANGEPIGFVGSLTDISDRKQAEIALQNLSDRLTLAMEAGGYGIWEWTLEHWLMWDDRVYAIYGLPNQGQISKYEDWRVFVHPDDIAQAEGNAHIEENGIFNSEFRIWQTDGEWRWVQSVGKVQRDANKNISNSST
ncbi:PAS domain-containing protein [Pseudanabaena minima]|uniref:PAS domain-containing protein n=1 Tax=Pseudanabaena minima TaxID=890415 RepID=UPI003DA8FA3B